jgi:hypothetical protein
MMGRNGQDQLNLFLTVVCLVLLVLSAFIRGGFGSFLNGLALALLILSWFRMLSRNLPRRRAENEKFLRWWGPRRDAITGARSRRADKAHKYVRCSCGAYCRVPRGVGKIELTCPKCGKKKIVKT